MITNPRAVRQEVFLNSQGMSQSPRLVTPIAQRAAGGSVAFFALGFPIARSHFAVAFAFDRTFDRVAVDFALEFPREEVAAPLELNGEGDYVVLEGAVFDLEAVAARPPEQASQVFAFLLEFQQEIYFPAALSCDRPGPSSVGVGRIGGPAGQQER